MNDITKALRLALTPEWPSRLSIQDIKSRLSGFSLYEENHHRRPLIERLRQEIPDIVDLYPEDFFTQAQACLDEATFSTESWSIPLLTALNPIFAGETFRPWYVVFVRNEMLFVSVSRLRLFFLMNLLAVDVASSVSNEMISVVPHLSPINFHKSIFSHVSTDARLMVLGPMFDMTDTSINNRPQNVFLSFVADKIESLGFPWQGQLVRNLLDAAEKMKEDGTFDPGSFQELSYSILESRYENNPDEDDQNDMDVLLTNVVDFLIMNRLSIDAEKILRSIAEWDRSQGFLQRVANLGQLAHELEEALDRPRALLMMDRIV